MKPAAERIDESKIFELDPIKIKVNEELPRHRKELGEIRELVESIAKFGQLQPIIINRDNELIAGGRRLAACVVGGFKARVVYKDAIDPVLMREMEIEENVRRKDFTPAEEALAIEELVKLKREIYGTPVQGRVGGFSLSDAARLIGKTKGNIIESLQIAEAIRMFPDLSSCTTKSEIKKAYKSFERTAKQLEALSSYEETAKDKETFFLKNCDAKEFLSSLSPNSFDLFFTDPPYGISIHEQAISLGGKTNGEFTVTGTKYDDSEDYAKALLETLAIESYRLTKDTGHAYIFCAPSYFWWLKDRMGAAGWLVRERPIIWIKRETGQNNQPGHWPIAAYEFILFARKAESQIVLQGRPDWIQCDLVLPSVRTHQAEKPIILCKELISRVCFPGAAIIDPCAGSGAIMEAAISMKGFAAGCELDVSSYASAIARLTKLTKENLE